ncbi:MAG: Wzz/FepE/Etk N-terminal domain-containing protein [Candidatus Bipolaricaulota bacterium]
MEKEVRDPYEYEVDLRDYIKVIWDEKWLIALIFIVAVGAALALSLSTTPKYRTQVSLIITSPVADKLVNMSGEPAGVVNFTSEFDYERVGYSEELINTIRSDLNLGGDSNDTASLSSVKNQMSLSLTPPGSSDNDTGKPILDLIVTGSNRERIKEIADKWGELYIQRASEILSSEVERYYELLSSEYSRVQEELEAKIEQRIDAREEQNLQLLKIETEILRNRYKDYFSSLEPKILDLEKGRTQLRRLNSILEDEPRYLYLERSVPSDSLMTKNQSSEERSGKETDNESEGANQMDEGTIKLQSEKINEIFMTFKEKEISADLEVSSLEKEVEYISSKLDEFKSKINAKQATIDRVQMKLEELDRELNRLNKSSDSLYSALEKARTAKNESGTIRLLTGAGSVKTLDSVNTKQNVAVAGVLGLFIGILAAFFKNYMEGYEEEEEEEGETTEE